MQEPYRVVGRSIFTKESAHKPKKDVKDKHQRVINLILSLMRRYDLSLIERKG